MLHVNVRHFADKDATVEEGQTCKVWGNGLLQFH